MAFNSDHFIQSNENNKISVKKGSISSDILIEMNPEK